MEKSEISEYLKKIRRIFQKWKIFIDIINLGVSCTELYSGCPKDQLQRSLLFLVTKNSVSFSLFYFFLFIYCLFKDPAVHNFSSYKPQTPHLWFFLSYLNRREARLRSSILKLREVRFFSISAFLLDPQIWPVSCFFCQISHFYLLDL